MTKRILPGIFRADPGHSYWLVDEDRLLSGYDVCKTVFRNGRAWEFVGLPSTAAHAFARTADMCAWLRVTLVSCFDPERGLNTGILSDRLLEGSCWSPCTAGPRTC